MPGQPLVEERVLAVDEIEDLPILADDVLEEELGLAAHREPQVVLEIRIAIPVAGDRFERAKLQPLTAEVLRERVRFRIAKHPPHLRGQDGGIAERPHVRRSTELRVRHAGPEEVGQS